MHLLGIFDIYIYISLSIYSNRLIKKTYIHMYIYIYLPLSSFFYSLHFTLWSIILSTRKVKYHYKCNWQKIENQKITKSNESNDCSNVSSSRNLSTSKTELLATAGNAQKSLTVVTKILTNSTSRFLNPPLNNKQKLKQYKQTNKGIVI